MLRTLVLIAAMMSGFQAKSVELDAPFYSIDGGTLSLSQWGGEPVLVVNTASICAYTKQYNGLQTLYNMYRDPGLVVLAVPSDEFKQELSSDEKVKEFCELQYGIDMPMTVITHVKGPDAHPFYKSLENNANYVPRWNFSNVLIGPRGDVIATYNSRTKSISSKITKDIEELLN